MENKKYRAAVYIRLSVKDNNPIQDESNSVASQRAIIRGYASCLSDVDVVEEFVDDGYSGVNFERPGFTRMLSKIYRGEINCVICKDLSRFGRNYVEVGRYVERIFPSYGVRFISVNEGMDTSVHNDWIRMLMPIYNLMNESYSKDISMKIRSQFAVKRKRGEHIGAYAPYGYKKSPNNKNQLIIDENVADHVRFIFRRRLEGFSCAAIARELNEKGIMCPGEYRKQCGRKGYAFQKKDVMQWDATPIRRILENEMYIGNMIQGKTYLANMKSQKVVEKPREEWDRVENTHKAIIEKRDFDLVQKIQKMDTRISQNTKKLHPLCGLIECADCGEAMIWVTKEIYHYYRCRAYKLSGKNACDGNLIPAEKVNKLVLEAIQERIIEIRELKRKLDQMGYEFLTDYNTQDLKQQAVDIQREIFLMEKKVEKILASVDGTLITTEGAELYKNKYEFRLEDLRNQYNEIQNKFRNARTIWNLCWTGWMTIWNLRIHRN